jgi:hypothetical protein
MRGAILVAVAVTVASAAGSNFLTGNVKNIFLYFGFKLLPGENSNKRYFLFHEQNNRRNSCLSCHVNTCDNAQKISYYSIPAIKLTYYL